MIYESPQKERIVTIFNDQIEINYRIDEKSIVIYDKVDRNNEPAVMSRSKRGLTEAFKALETALTPDFTFSQAWNSLQASGIKTHYWCRMD